MPKLFKAFDLCHALDSCAMGSLRFVTYVRPEWEEY